MSTPDLPIEVEAAAPQEIRQRIPRLLAEVKALSARQEQSRRFGPAACRDAQLKAIADLVDAAYAAGLAAGAQGEREAAFAAGFFARPSFSYTSWDFDAAGAGVNLRSSCPYAYRAWLALLSATPSDAPAGRE